MRHFWLLLFAVSFVMAEENHWSYEIPKTPKIPEIQSNDWVNNEIDFFIFSEMEKKGKSAPGEKRSWRIRMEEMDKLFLMDAVQNAALSSAARKVVADIQEFGRMPKHKKGTS